MTRTVLPGGILPKGSRSALHARLTQHQAAKTHRIRLKSYHGVAAGASARTALDAGRGSLRHWDSECRAKGRKRYVRDRGDETGGGRGRSGVGGGWDGDRAGKRHDGGADGVGDRE